VVVEFDGVYMNSDVWINGQFLGRRPYGFIGFRYDLTEYLKPTARPTSSPSASTIPPSRRRAGIPEPASTGTSD
jgi:beta-galactosidase